MSNTLYQDQQAPEMKVLLGAQKRLYYEGKRQNAWIFLAALLSAIIAPVIIAYLPEAKTGVGITVGIASFVVSLLTKKGPEKKREKAAKIQEEFDTRLFGMAWNESLCGPKVDKFDISAANGRLKTDRENVDLIPWYSDYSSLSPSQAVLHCQGENLWWDRSLRKRYAGLLSVLLIALVAWGVAWAAGILQLNLLESITEVFLPMSGLGLVFYFAWQEHRKVAAEQERTATEGRRISDTYLDQQKEVPPAELRRLQDAIFKNRTSSPLVPEWFFKFNRKYLEKQSSDAAQTVNQA